MSLKYGVDSYTNVLRIIFLLHRVNRLIITSILLLNILRFSLQNSHKSTISNIKKKKKNLTTFRIWKKKKKTSIPFTLRGRKLIRARRCGTYRVTVIRFNENVRRDNYYERRQKQLRYVRSNSNIFCCQFISRLTS